MADLHLTLDREKGGLTGQIAGKLRESIRSGWLPVNTRLPASRDLARDLGLSRGVVVEAYEQLVAEGFLEARVGVGTWVAAGPGPRRHGVNAVDASGPRQGKPRHGNRPTSPDLAAFPRQAWLGAVRQVLATVPGEALDYPDPGGVPELRAELAVYLRRVRAADAAPENVVIVSGVAQGISLTIQALSTRRRAVLAVEDPTSHRQLPLLRRTGAEVVRVPVDAEGLDVAELAATGADAVLLTPAHQYPTGVVLSPRRRTDLVAWATETGAVVLEDDYDAEFRYDRDPVGCLQGLAPDHVVLAGSVSKAMAPGLRLGWLVAPAPIAGSVRLARAELDLGSPVIDQHVLAHLMRTGGYDRHLRRMRREYRARRDALVRALREHFPAIKVQGISAGLHLYAVLPTGWDDTALAAAAQRVGLGAEPVGPGHGPALVIGFARLPAHTIAGAVRALARLWVDRARPGAGAVHAARRTRPGG